MTQFTPQQLTGQKGYRPRTLVGNWSEDIQYHEDEMKDYMSRKEGGQLLSQQIKGKVAQHKQLQTLTPPPEDGYLRIGQLYCLQSGETQGLLSVDLDDQLTPLPHRKFAVTTRPASVPMARNTFMFIAQPHPEDEHWQSKGEGDVLHYGQKVHIVLNPDLKKDGKQMHLHSERLTPSCHSPVTGEQEVALASHGTSALNWEFLYANPEFRFEMEGQPVKANSIVIISHCVTGQYLASHKKTHLNDFGGEFEVFGKKVYQVRGKNNECRPEAPANHWVCVTALGENE